jgi:hypothetical protein
MPVFHVISEPLRMVEAGALCMWLMAGGVLVGWLRWGKR